MPYAKTKQTIIKTASRLFYQNGYNRTGINEIIAESGIAKATLYAHFKSKEDLCVAYIQFMSHSFLMDIKKFCTHTDKGINQPMILFDFLLQFFKEKKFNGSWCLNTLAEIPKENQKVRSVIQEQKQKFIELIRALVKENKVCKKDKKIDALSRQIYLLYEGALSESHLHQQDWPIKSAKKLCRQILI